MEISKIKTKREEIQVLEEMYDFLADKLKSSPFTQYKIVGKTENQKKNWRTDELMWEDEEKTIPVYEDKWDTVVVPEEEYTDEMKARKTAIENLMKALDKFV